MATKKSEDKPDLKVVKKVEDPKTDITADELVDLNDRYVTQETKIGSLQGKLRKQIGEEWKDREVDPKAMAHMRVGMKIGDERKRIHYFRTVLAVAGDLLAKYEGEATAEMSFDEPDSKAS